MSGNNRDDDHLNDIFNMQSPQWKKNFGDVQSSSPVNGGMVYGGMPEQPMVMGLEGDILGEPLNGETINGPKPENAVPMNNWTSVNSDNLRQLDTLYHEGDDLLSPINLQGGQGHQAPQQLLDPKSPSVYSAYSGHTDTSSHPASPYMDAVSHFSSAYSNISTHQPPPPGFLPAGNNFEGEIALGASISNINLNRFFDHEDAPRKTEQPSAGPTGSTGLLDTGYGHVDRLTENNLTNYDSQYNKEVKISIQTPEEVAGKAPSLFSNSSANSSTHFSADPLSNDHLQSEHGLAPNSNYLSSPGSAVSDSNSLLNPEELQSMKRGRRKSHSYKQQKSRSRSISKSPAVSDDEGDNLQVSVSSREKMLELASPNQSSKRTQKHPSVYACHLCDKRFTRPYNLKSHLRTHTDERPFICNVCGKAFARQHDRKRHEDLHTGEKKFQCKGFLKDGTPYGCGRKFARADALRRHFQTEAGKECIRLLVEEDERDKQNGGTGRTFDGNDYLSPGSAMMASNASVPQVAISPPD